MKFFSFMCLSLLSIASKQKMFKVLSLSRANSVESPGVSPSMLLCVLYVGTSAQLLRLSCVQGRRVQTSAHTRNIPCKEFWASFAGFRDIAGSAAGQQDLASM